MIIKNLTRKNNSGQLLRYILRYILTKEKQALSDRTLPKPFLIRKNIRSRTLEGYIHEFKSVESNRVYKRSDQTALHHTILSWSDKDAMYVTDEMLSDIAKQYIKLRGENNLYLGTVHRDRSHIHIHIAVSATQLNGKASRVSKEKFAAIKTSLNLYQKEKYPELSHSLPNHGKKFEFKKTADLIQPFFAKSRISKKELLAAQLERIRSSSKSLDEFLHLLQLQNYEPYFWGSR